MKNTAVLVNTSRGAVVNKEYLCAALGAEQIAGVELSMQISPVQLVCHLLAPCFAAARQCLAMLA